MKFYVMGKNSSKQWFIALVFLIILGLVEAGSRTTAATATTTTTSEGESGVEELLVDGKNADELFFAKILLLPLGILFCFVGLAIVCDDYLAPALEEFVERFGVPHDVASATFLAFGSSAPEISINCIATLNDKVNMSLGAVLGSGIIAYTVIPAACVLVSDGQLLKLETIPLLRDLSFYILSVILFVAFSNEGKFDTGKDALLLSLFFVYLGALITLGKFYHTADQDREEAEHAAASAKAKASNNEKHGCCSSGGCNSNKDLEGANDETKSKLLAKKGESLDAIQQVALEKPKLLLSRHKTVGEGGNTAGGIGYGTIENTVNDPRVFEGQHELEEAEGLFENCLDVFAAPIRCVFRVTIPPFCPTIDEDANNDDDDDDGPGFEIGNSWPGTMFVSLIYVSLLSELVLVLTTMFADVVGLPHHIAGLTILALGAQVPDLVASVSVAKKGEGPSSIANAVGSQIINILVGVAFPFLIYNLKNSRPVVVSVGSADSGKGLALTGVMLVLLILLFAGLCFRHVVAHRHSHIESFRKPALNSLDAVLLSSFYVATITILACSETFLAK